MTATYWIELRSQSGKSHRIRTVSVRADEYYWNPDRVMFRQKTDSSTEDVLSIASSLVVSVSRNRRLRS